MDECFIISLSCSKQGKEKRTDLEILSLICSFIEQVLKRVCDVVDELFRLFPTEAWVGDGFTVNLAVGYLL